MAIWALALFYVTLITFLLWVGPDRIAQAMYDFAQEISHLRFGWAILGGMIGQSAYALLLNRYSRGAAVLVSFPPFIGHTTILTLCGFAYGMKGFLVAACASIVGSAAAFIVLRLLFSRRLKAWSASSEKWQALEAVVVSTASSTPVESLLLIQ